MATKADFAAALVQVLKYEGGYNPKDPSYRGIMQSTYNDWRVKRGLPKQDVRQITNDELTTIYYEDYWLKVGCDKLPMPLALVHFDTAVNMGVGAAQTLLKASGADSTAYLALRQKRYQNIAAANPEKHGGDLPVWLRRVASLGKIVTSPPGVTAVTVLGFALAGWALWRVFNR